MATNPLRAAIAQADRDNRTLQTLFNQTIGTADRPRGRILSVYRQGRQAMAQALQVARPMPDVMNVLAEMRAGLRDAGRNGLLAAANAGRASAERQLSAYLADGVQYRAAGETVDVAALEDAWLASFDQQAQAVRTALLSGQDTDLILGDEGRMGLLQPAPVARDDANWLSTALALGISLWVSGREGRDESERIRWQKQAIAAIDERTTDCCLRVHAQIVALKAKFNLTGTPRFADKLNWAPFHWWCRTSVALYLPEYEDGISAEMRSAADAELVARAVTGERVEIHPSHARSRR